MRPCVVRDLGRLRYEDALAVQNGLIARRKLGEIPDQLVLVEHPNVITLGRNGNRDHLLADENILDRAGISFYPANRGGDITYHGPGQIVGYPILDLREWKRDVVAYLRALEQVIMDALLELGVKSGRLEGLTGVWVDGRKVAAIGVHISRWVTSHGFALNHTTDLSYFQYIVPCGLSQPVTSLRELGVDAGRAEVTELLVRHFGRVFGVEIQESETVRLTETT
jgi:lipoyl(octanoyl) transferase